MELLLIIKPTFSAVRQTQMYPCVMKLGSMIKLKLKEVTFYMSHYLTEFYPKFRDLLIFQITCVGRRRIKIYTAVLNNKFN